MNLPSWWSRRRLGGRTRAAILLAAATGLLTGAGVALFEWIAREQLLDRLLEAPAAVQIGAPLVGLLLAGVVLALLGRGASSSTADEYVRNFHDHAERLDLRPVPARLLASVATLGLGGAMGFEGPSIYLGAATGSALQRRLSRFFSRDDAKVLLVAGAAAGVAAIFRAPATGLVFALEVPYQEDFARRMLLPAGIASAVSYLTFVSFAGTAPIFAISGAPPFDLRDLGGALLLGVVCGVGARAFTTSLVAAKRLAQRVNPYLRAVGAGLGLAGLAALSFAVFGDGLTVGAGYDNLEWAIDPRRPVGQVVLLLVLRALATVLTVGSGGVGGLFIPLVIEGALVGRAVSGVLHPSALDANFFPVVGVSAFLGAGYRVPLAGVVFAAEATGRPGFIVPGLLASIVAQLLMGDASACPYQKAGRVGHLERRLDLPVAAALQADVRTVPSDTTLAEFFHNHVLATRETVVPVVDGERFLGLMRLQELRDVPGDRWDDLTVADHLCVDLPKVDTQARLREAMTLMERADVDVVPVVDDDRFVGVVTSADVLKLEDILEQQAEKRS